MATRSRIATRSIVLRHGAPVGIALLLGACGGSTPTGSTWTDPAGITWTLDNAPTTMNYADAVAYCAALSPDGKPGWRLPTVSELRTLLTACPVTQTGGACGVTAACASNDTCWTKDCQGCTPPTVDTCYRLSALTGACDFTWSSTVRSDDTTNAWGVYFNNAGVNTNLRDNTSRVRCCR